MKKDTPFNPEVHVDVINRPIKIGDYVTMIAAHYRRLLIGKVAAYTPQNIRVAPLDNAEIYSWSARTDKVYTPSSLCIIGGEEILMYLLKR